MKCFWAELAQRNGTLPPPPGLISDSVNIVHSAIKVHCAAGGEGGGGGIDRNAAENEDERKGREKRVKK